MLLRVRHHAIGELLGVRRRHLRQVQWYQVPVHANLRRRMVVMWRSLPDISINRFNRSLNESDMVFSSLPQLSEWFHVLLLRALSNPQQP